MTLFWRFERPDWSRTRAFMLAGDLEGLIQVNLKGRERDGIVEPGAECDALLDEITAGFQTFHDIDTGDPLVLDVHRGRDIWPEAIQRRAMPDLVIRNPRSERLRHPRIPVRPLWDRAELRCRRLCGRAQRASCR